MAQRIAPNNRGNPNKATDFLVSDAFLYATSVGKKSRARLNVVPAHRSRPTPVRQGNGGLKSKPTNVRPNQVAWEVFLNTQKWSQCHWRAQRLRELRRDGVGLQVLRVRSLNANGRALEGVLNDLRVRRCPALDLPARDTHSHKHRETERRERGVSLAG